MTAKQFEKLFKSIKADLEAVNKLGIFCYAKIISHIDRKYHGLDLGRDVAQEFFVRAINTGQGKKIEYPEDGVEYPISWIFRICDNIAKEFISDDKKQKLAFVKENSTSIDEVFDKVLFGVCYKQIESYEKPTSLIMLMHFYEGIPLNQISEELNINYASVRQYCSRGLKKIRKNKKFNVTIFSFLYSIK